MEKAGAIANKTQEVLKKGSTTQAGQKVDLENVKKINVIFELFNAHYTFWLYGKDDVDKLAVRYLWLAKLSHIDPATAALATDRAFEEFPDRAPTPGQFLKLCKIRTEPAHQNFPRLPPPNMTASVVEIELEKMRQVTNAKGRKK